MLQKLYPFLQSRVCTSHPHCPRDAKVPFVMNIYELEIPLIRVDAAQKSLILGDFFFLFLVYC
jgi:hypothetical protein